ncbi:MAG: transglycosylase SLT domain-containing protein, partial [Cycloclasticus sp.]|nr:transglycosylase SLT domain-containing protein [Cycloclasticus sp.]
MRYLITNKTICFLLFASFTILTSCTSLGVKAPETTEFSVPIKSETPANVGKERHVEKNSSSVAILPENLWQRLFSLYKLPTIENERIQAEINWYSKHPEYLERVQKNAAPYLFHIVNEIEKRDIPGELALLPIVESAYRPFAYSHGRAAGLWQFIPSTGLAFGLQQTWWYDGRRDVFASTNAALTYLTKLSKRFNNDWFLALTCYNACL